MTKTKDRRQKTEGKTKDKDKDIGQRTKDKGQRTKDKDNIIRQCKTQQDTNYNRREDKTTTTQSHNWTVESPENRKTVTRD